MLYQLETFVALKVKTIDNLTYQVTVQLFLRKVRWYYTVALSYHNKMFQKLKKIGPQCVHVIIKESETFETKMARNTQNSKAKHSLRQNAKPKHQRL